MLRSVRQAALAFGSALQTAAVALVFIAATAVVTRPALAQTFSVIHYFSGGADGAFPTASLTMDQAGRLYGTAVEGGTYQGPQCTDFGCGVVFRMTHSSSGWVVTPVYTFPGSPTNGIGPYAPVTVGPDGTIYGTTGDGPGCYNGCGVVFRLTPPPTFCRTPLCPWHETVIHEFTGQGDGEAPGPGGLTFDSAGGIYGTTTQGGANGKGIVYKLTPSGNSWTEAVLYSFVGAGDGAQPQSGVILDNAGNLYGTTFYGGDLGCDFSQGCGTVFELTPSGSGWTETTLYTFEMNTNIGNFPRSGLVFDASGNLYGTTPEGGTHDGTVYELSPSNGSWTATALQQFMGNGGPLAGLTMDAAGNLYGTTTASGAYYQGSVFELKKQAGGWQFISLHDFDITDGDHPEGGVILDSSGNIFGTTSQGGAGSCYAGCGVIFEITP